MPLAQGTERREPPSECVAGGMETHPAAGRLISVDSLSSLLFHLCWKPSHRVTVLPGCGSMGTTEEGGPVSGLEKLLSSYKIPVGKISYGFK